MSEEFSGTAPYVFHHPKPSPRSSCARGRAAHEHTDHDKFGRISRTVAKVGNEATTNTTVQDKTYCYTAGTTPAGGCTGGADPKTYTDAGGSQSELIKQKTTRGNYEYGYGRTNQFGLPVVEQVTFNGKTAHLENDPVTGQPLMLRTAEGVQSLYVYDGIGNPEALVTNQDSTTFAYDYDPYGVPALNDENGEGDPVNPFQFKGGIHDRSTNWVKFGYRWYSVGTGRFTQRDTLDAPLDPANANRYTFAGNDPINYSDPLGLYSWADVGSDCFKGAVFDAGFEVALAFAATPGSVALAAGGGCAGSVEWGYLGDQLPEDKRDNLDRGTNYMDLLKQLGNLEKRFL